MHMGQTFRRKSACIILVNSCGKTIKAYGSTDTDPINLDRTSILNHLSLISTPPTDLPYRIDMRVVRICKIKE